MRKSFGGTGSALVALVFSTLCLTIFSLISLSAASIDKSMSEAEARAVKQYYEADLLAEQILAEIIEAEDIPDEINGIEIYSEENSASFSCLISDAKELYVEISLANPAYDVMEWRARDIGEWEKDDGLPVWSGD